MLRFSFSFLALLHLGLFAIMVWVNYWVFDPEDRLYHIVNESKKQVMACEKKTVDVFLDKHIITLTIISFLGLLLDVITQENLWQLLLVSYSFGLNCALAETVVWNHLSRKKIEKDYPNFSITYF